MPSAVPESARLDHDALRDAIGAAPIARFETDLRRLGWNGEPLGVAISGGPDSTALLLLAIAVAGTAAVRAATVDHGLRVGARAEAEAVAELCHAMGVEHAILNASIPRMRGGPQAAARQGRYLALDLWQPDGWLLVGHHRDDVAESLLMRLARGSGVRGLSRMAEHYRLYGVGASVLRPLLDWSRTELAELCDRAAAPVIHDPSNQDPRYDRSRARATLAANPWLDPARIARTARNLAEADAALTWLADRIWGERVMIDHPPLVIRFDPADLPHDTRRRIVARIMGRFTGADESRDLETLIAMLERGEHAMLGDVQAIPGPAWTFRRAPPRRAS